MKSAYALPVFAGLSFVPGAAQARVDAVPTPNEIRRAESYYNFQVVLGSVNCEGRTECYNRYPRARVRDADCVATGPEAARCNYDLFDRTSNLWVRTTSDLKVDAGVDGKIGWRVVRPVN